MTAYHDEHENEYDLRAKSATLDTKALEAARAWFNGNFNGMPDTDALVSGVVEAYLSATPSRADILEEAARVVAGFIRYGGSTEHGITINPYAGATEILRAIRALVKPE